MGTRENYCVFAEENCDAIASLFVLGIEILTICGTAIVCVFWDSLSIVFSATSIFKHQ